MVNPELPEIEEAANIYRLFMEEIKTRLNVIADAVAYISKNPDLGSAFLHAEFAFLQLRFICDLIALAVLAAHKPYGLSDELMESWHARRALNDLKAINPISFPRPVKLTEKDGVKHLDISDAGALKREGLQRIYNKCGRLLHRGVIKHIFEGQTKAFDIASLERWASQIGALLSHHALLIPDKGLVLVVILATDPNGAVQVAIAQAPGPAVFVPPTAKQPPPRAAKSPRRPAKKRHQRKRK